MQARAQEMTKASSSVSKPVEKKPVEKKTYEKKAQTVYICIYGSRYFAYGYRICGCGGC